MAITFSPTVTICPEFGLFFSDDNASNAAEKLSDSINWSILGKIFSSSGLISCSNHKFYNRRWAIAIYCIVPG